MSEHEINRVLLSGRLTSDPDLRELPDGTPVCVLRLASQTRRRTPGASRTTASEFNVLLLGAKARRIAPYLYRGRRVIVQGRLQAERWEDGEGPERKALCVIAERIHFAGHAPHGAQTRTPTQRARANDTALSMSAAIGFSEQIWG
jgi:single-strand DNA-binding protein